MRCSKVRSNGGVCKNFTSSNFCYQHTSCKICKEHTSLKYKITLKNCGHVFCKFCLSEHINQFQWFNGFSTEHSLLCPCCDEYGGNKLAKYSTFNDKQLDFHTYICENCSCTYRTRH